MTDTPTTTDERAADLWSDDPEMNAALQADADKLRGMGLDPGPDMYALGLVTCPERDGLGEWDEGPLPSGRWADEPEYRQVICPECGGSGRSLATQGAEPMTPADDARREQEFRKTATIRATQWWKLGDHPAVVLKSDPNRYADEGIPWCPTLEGGHVVTPGDWIATGAQGEHWPIKSDVFAATYEEVREPAEPVSAGEGAELLPCPFCGAQAVFVRDHDADGDFVAVQCTECGCGSGKHYPLMDDARPNAANEWNRRPAPPAPEVEMEEDQDDARAMSVEGAMMRLAECENAQAERETLAALYDEGVSSAALRARPATGGADAWNDDPTPEQDAEIMNHDGPLSRGQLHPWDFYKIIRAAGPPARPSAEHVERPPREPTEAMLNAARDWSVSKYGQGVGNADATGCWQAMLDAALTPDPERKVEEGE